jgi:hypothetical protein
MRITENTHGGRRKHSGRKPTGRKAYLVSMKPVSMKALRKFSKQSGAKHVGEFLERTFTV